MSDEDNFYYAAYSYLDEWMAKDQNFHKILAYESRNDTTVEIGTQELRRVAAYYKVARTLKDNGEELHTKPSKRAKPYKIFGPGNSREPC